MLTYIQTNVWDCVLLIQAWECFSGKFLIMEWSLISRVTHFCSLLHEKYLLYRLFLILYFHRARKIKRSWIWSPIGMCTPPPRTQWLTSEFIGMVSILDPKHLMGNGKLFAGSYQYSRYRNVISEIIKEHEVSLNTMTRLKA